VTFIRSRVGVALIGLVIMGGAGAAVAVATSPQPYRAALVASNGQTRGGHTAVSLPTATATTRVIPATPTRTAVPRPTATSLAPPTGQTIRGSVLSTDPATGTFVVSSNSSQVKVSVTNATIFQGDAASLSGLAKGWRVHVTGTTLASGTFLATSVYATNVNNN
jgi:hypothetical protein